MEVNELFDRLLDAKEQKRIPSKEEIIRLFHSKSLLKGNNESNDTQSEPHL